MSLYKLPLSVLRSKLPELSAEKTAQLLAVAAKLGLQDPLLAEQVGPGSEQSFQASSGMDCTSNRSLPKVVKRAYKNLYPDLCTLQCQGVFPSIIQFIGSKTMKSTSFEYIQAYCVSARGQPLWSLRAGWEGTHK